MSRKHFEIIAAALKRVKPANVEGPTEGYTPEYRQWEETVRAIAGACSDCNNRFLFTTFADACGLDA